MICSSLDTCEPRLRLRVRSVQWTRRALGWGTSGYPHLVVARALHYRGIYQVACGWKNVAEILAGCRAFSIPFVVVPVSSAEVAVAAWATDKEPNCLGWEPEVATKIHQVALESPFFGAALAGACCGMFSVERSSWCLGTDAEGRDSETFLQ